MKYHTIFFVFFILLIACHYQSSVNKIDKSEKTDIDTINKPLNMKDALSDKANEKMDIKGYKVIINEGTDFWIHKDSIKSIMAKIEVNHMTEIVKVNINSPAVFEEIKENHRKTGNLSIICSDSSDVNYVVSDNTLFNFPYFEYGYKRIKNKYLILNENYIVFMNGCNGFNVFNWEIKADSFRLKTIFPDFLIYPSILSYWTSIDLGEVITSDSINYFIALRKLVNWSDLDEAEHVECDENSEIYVLHYNSESEQLKKIYQLEIQGEHYFDGMAKYDSILVVKHSYHSYTLLFQDKEGNIVQSYDDYPFENPDLIQYDQIDNVTYFSDTIFIDKYIE